MKEEHVVCESCGYCDHCGDCLIHGCGSKKKKMGVDGS